MPINSTTTCTFSDPIDLDPDVKLSDFEFSTLNCSSYTTSTSSTSTLQFSSGEIVISVFLFFILCLALYSFIYDSMISKNITISND